MNDENPAEKIKRLMRQSMPASSKVIDLASAARERGRPLPPRKVTPPQVVSIRGNNNAGVIGNSNHIQINVRGAARPKIQVTPGVDEVDNAQAAEIKRLVAVVVDKSGKTFPHIYSTIYRRFNTTSYLMLKRHLYTDVVGYLNKWIASVSRTAVGADSETQRKNLLRRIHAQVRKNAGRLDSVHSYVSGRFGTPSLAELTPGQLHEVIKQFGL